MSDRGVAAVAGTPFCAYKAAEQVHSRAVVWLLLVLLVDACGQPVATSEPIYLRAAGSTSMAPLVSALATAFAERAPNVHLQVTGLGTQFGWDALQRGDVDLAMVSWLSPEAAAAVSEAKWDATAIARQGVAVIVNPSNRVEGLGLLQLQDVFSGRTYAWEALPGLAASGPIQPMSREQGSGTRSAFESLVMGDKRMTPWAVVAPSSQAVVDYVAAHPGAIGYVSMAFVSSAVKVVRIEGELPTPERVREGQYPLSRELWLVTAEPSATAVREFLEFALDPAGQQIVGRGYARID